MKRTLSVLALLLAALMLMSVFAACGKEEAKTDDPKPQATEAPTLEGSYKLTDYKGDDVDYYISIKDTVELTIDSSNIGDMTVSGESYLKLTFDTEKMEATAKDAEPIPYTFDGTVLRLEDAAGMMEFTRK